MKWSKYTGSLLLLALLVCGCGIEAAHSASKAGAEEYAGAIAEEAADTVAKESADTLAEEQKHMSGNTSSVLDVLPEYDGEPYAELNENVPYFSEEEKKSTDEFERYSDLDSLGRCGQAYANICQNMMPAEERGSIGQIRPSGWHTVKYQEKIADNYLYNRCHLIAYQLAGENANEKNLITGTRYLNVEGMLPFENKVFDYVKETGNHVLYRVTPIFEGDNLVASGVEMEGWSVEDFGDGICFHVYCYNVQPGIWIDYASGESCEAEKIVPSKDTADGAKEEEGTAKDPKEENRDYILNQNTKRIHRPDCFSVNEMAEHNKQEYTGTLSELMEKGYTPCGRCLSEFR